jgi:predicted nucleotidyltransferase
MVTDTTLPKAFEQDITRAVKILKEYGCSEIFVFGSATTGMVREDSDLDLAVRGCPSGEFFHLVGELLFQLDHPVDLVDLDTQDPFAEHLQKEGALVRVG